jgi:AraC-like DNA-binding protein
MTQIKYEELHPDRHLKNFVKRFWKLSNATADTIHFTILPDGYFDLIVNIADNKLAGIFLTGFHTKDFEVAIPNHTSFLGISFLPLAVEYLFHQSISSLLNKQERIALDFWHLNKIGFADFKCWTEDVSKHMFLLQTDEKNIDERKQKLFVLLFQSKGSLKVEDISKSLFWNSRQINRYFKNTFGLSLKSRNNILRCRVSYNHIKKGTYFRRAILQTRDILLKK